MKKEMNLNEITLSHIVYQNINGKKTLLLRDGTVLPEQARTSIQAYSFFDYYDDYYKKTIIDTITTPYFIVTGYGSINHLETYKLNDSDIQILNKFGLKIYLYEIMSLDLGERKLHNTMFPRTVDIQKEFEIFKYTRQGFESTEENLKNIYGYELESIRLFVKNNNLTNVSVYTTEYNSNILENQYPEFSIRTDDCYIKSLFKIVENKFNSYQYPSTPPQIQKIEYKFWSGNRRYSGHRHLISAYLADRSVQLSYNKNRQWQQIQDYLWFDFNGWSTSVPHVYNKLIKNIDMDDREIDQNLSYDHTNLGDIWNNYVPVEYYTKCFVCIVTETRYSQPFGLFSEKTLNAIKCLRPFVLVAPPKTLEYLKKYGVETFGDIWDESYDQELNHERRLLKIFEVIDYIDSFSIEQLQDLYNKLTPRLLHNYEIIRNIPNVSFPDLM